MTETVKIRGHVFEIVTGGDWGGGDEAGAIKEVIEALDKLKLSALVVLHEALLDEQQLGSLVRTWSDAAICEPIVCQLAHPPEDAINIGASVHLRAHERYS